MVSWASRRSGAQAFTRERLACIECGQETTATEKGWRAVHAGGIEDELEVAVYCPDCAEREFGEDETA